MRGRRHLFPFAFAAICNCCCSTYGSAATISKDKPVKTSGISIEASGKKKLIKNVGSTHDENLVVLGSALASKANANANPVQTVTAKEIHETSASTLGDYLQRLPSVGSSSQQNTQPNGGAGMSCTDLRNLGTNRVLVLVDGKRQIQTFGNGGSCVNLNSIPLDQIASVELLKDGGSELYGADAVSGVINVKLKHNLTTGGVDVRGGISDIGDGQMGRISAYKGLNFDHDRGNITVFGSYMTQSEVMQRDRKWARNVWLNNPEIGGSPSFGTSITPNARAYDSQGEFNLVSNNTGGGVNGFHPYTAADNYNYALSQSLMTGIQQGSLSGDVGYKVSDHLNFYTNVRYTHQDSHNTMAPLGVSGATYPSTLPSNAILPAGSPYNIWGRDVTVYKRFTELGDREYNTAYDTWQVNGGARGQIVGNWNYDISMAYGASRSAFRTNNMVNYRNLTNALGTRQLDPTDANSLVVFDPSVCQASSGCSLYNPWAPVDGATANYLQHTQLDTAMYQMRDFNARIDNNQLVKMPYEYGGYFGLAAGVEHRSEQASYTPDALATNGDLGGGASYTGGGYNVTEAYIEGRLNLLHDAFLAKDLTIDGQGRWSHYSTFGNAYNWKGSINWAPVQDIRFRATLGTSFRAPSISELYVGRGVGYYSGTDPCEAASSYGAYAGNVAARCAREGINTANFSNANTGTLPELGGGNPNLQPEIGRSYTIGAVITPRWIKGLSIDVDYWHYSLKNMIGTLGGQYILDQCYTGSAEAMCQYVGARSSSKQLTQIVTTNQNIGGLRTNGIDIDLTYRLRLGIEDTITLNNNLQYLVGYNQQNEPDGPWYHYSGRVFYLGGGVGFPQIRDYATVSWRHGPVSLTYMMSYTDKIKYNDGTNDVSCAEYAYCKIPGIFTHDVTVDYRMGSWNLQAGVNNLFDKKPPFVATGGGNTDPALYASSIMGRYVFMSAGVKF